LEATGIEFGHRCNVLKQEHVLECIDAGMTASLNANRDRMPDPRIRFGGV